MAINPLDIQLSDEQRTILAQRANETGRPWPDLLDEMFGKLSSPKRNGTPPRSLFDALNERGIIGAFDGPTDLSTNPKHMEGFGSVDRFC